MKSNQDEADKMSINYATANCAIKHVNMENLQQSNLKMQFAIETSLKGLKVDN